MINVYQKETFLILTFWWVLNLPVFPARGKFQSVTIRSAVCVDFYLNALNHFLQNNYNNYKRHFENSCIFETGRANKDRKRCLLTPVRQNIYIVFVWRFCVIFLPRRKLPGTCVDLRM